MDHAGVALGLLPQICQIPGDGHRTDGVEPLYSPVIHECAFRDDVAERRAERSAILADAPQTDGSFFIVPRIVEGK